MPSSFNVDGLGETETWTKIYEVNWRDKEGSHSKPYINKSIAEKFIHDRTKILKSKCKFTIKERILYLDRSEISELAKKRYGVK